MLFARCSTSRRVCHGALQQLCSKAASEHRAASSYSSDKLKFGVRKAGTRSPSAYSFSDIRSSQRVGLCNTKNLWQGKEFCNKASSDSSRTPTEEAASYRK